MIGEKPERVLVCGGRDFTDKARFDSIMDGLVRHFAPDFCIIEGEAAGADSLAATWALARGTPCLGVRAAWQALGRRKAGPMRNGWMLQWCNPDIVVAFPGGYGTADMVRRAKAAGVTTYEI